MFNSEGTHIFARTPNKKHQMNLRLFFNPFTEEELEQFADKQALFEEIDYHHDSLPNWQEAEIAIFSVDLANTNDFLIWSKILRNRNSRKPIIMRFGRNWQN